MERKVDDDELLRLYDNGEGMRRIDLARHFDVSPSYITKRLGQLIPPEMPESMKSLTEKEQRYVLARAEGKTQTDSALSAFECGSRDSAKVIGSQLAGRGDIQLAVSEIMQQEGLTRRKRVRRLKDHIDDQRADVSLKALDQSWKLDGAYQETRVEVQVDYNELVHQLTDIQAERRKLMKDLGLDPASEIVEVEADE